MPKVTFIEISGARHEIDAKTGQSLMEAAVQNMVPGIDADCGGACACATCHVYVADGWAGKLGTQDDMEKSMLDFAEDVRPSSRLSCQIQISEDLDGIIVNLPEAQ